jgi:hypothetical protein
VSIHRLDQFHSDPANWKYGIFYFCRADPRIIVPKRIIGLGWTLNFARPMAVPFVLLLLAVIWGVLELLRHLGASAEVRLCAKICLATGVIALCYYLAHRRPPSSDAKPDSADPAP